MSPASIMNGRYQLGNHLECQGICSSFAVFDCSNKYLMKILLDYSAEWNKLMGQVAKEADLIFTKWSGIIIYFAYYMSLLRGLVRLHFPAVFKRYRYSYRYGTGRCFYSSWKYGTHFIGRLKTIIHNLRSRNKMPLTLKGGFLFIQLYWVVPQMLTLWYIKLHRVELK